MPAYEELANRQADLIRKALAGSVFVADANAELPAQLTTGESGELAALPQGYTDLGWISKEDGVNWARETEVSEVTSWGAFQPTRRDVNSDVTSLTVIAQETNIRTLGMYHHVDMAGVTADATTGEVAFNSSVRPAAKYYRVFAVFVDGSGDEAIYVARLLPRATVSEVGEQAWQDGDEPVRYELTLTATPDGDAGYAVRHFFGGPGWAKLLDKMGFARGDGDDDGDGDGNSGGNDGGGDGNGPGDGDGNGSGDGSGDGDSGGDNMGENRVLTTVSATF